MTTKSDDALRARMRERLTDDVIALAIQRWADEHIRSWIGPGDDVSQLPKAGEDAACNAAREVLLDHLVPALAEDRQALAARLVEVERDLKDMERRQIADRQSALANYAKFQAAEAARKHCVDYLNERTRELTMQAEEAEAKLAAVEAERDMYKQVALDAGNAPIHARDYQNVCDAVVYECRRADEAEAKLAACERLILDLQAHAREYGWQDYDDPIAALLAYEPREALKADATPAAPEPSQEPVKCIERS